MIDYINMLSWWQMPLTAIGSILLGSLGEFLSYFTVIGVFYFFIKSL